jgi:N-acetylglucosaminyl-diphospho-decaprenol L-rhamnosyltransferase
MEPVISYCVVNTSGRDYLLACLEAIEAHHPPTLGGEILVLDNASDDGSVAAVRAWEESRPEPAPAGPLKLIALEKRQGKAASDSQLMREARGNYCLLLNEDSELLPGAAMALVEALDTDPSAGAAGAQLLDGEHRPYPCAWRFPGVLTALIGALFLHRWLTVQSRSDATRRVDWAQSSALLVRRDAAEAINYMDPDFFVYYDECDFCKRLADAGLHTLYVPSAQAIHHNQLDSAASAAGMPRIVEFHRNRDLYMRKHHGPLAAAAVRFLTAWAYGLRALVASRRDRDEARAYRLHARQALQPGRGISIRDRVEGSSALRD